MEYEEYFITDCNAEIDGICDRLGEYTGIDEINYLATLLDEMAPHELELYQAAIETGDYCGSLQDLINLTDNLDCFYYYQGVKDDYDIGYCWVEESGCYDIKNMGNLTNYIDYERFGRDIRINEGGTFTDNGYVCNNGDSFSEFYDGMDVPEEYRVFSMEQSGPTMTMTM